MRRRLPPTPGRFWWAEALCAMAPGLFGIAGSVWALSAILPIDEAHHQSNDQDLMFGVGIALIGLLFSAFFFHDAARDLKRWRMRRATLLGDQDTMSPAVGIPVPAEPPDVSQPPLEMLWRASPSLRFFLAPLMLGGALLALGMIAASEVLLIVILILAPPGLTPDVRNILLSVVPVLLAGMIGLVFFIVRALPTYFGRICGIIASDMGLDYRDGFGRRHALSWRDARLFEVEKTNDGSLRFYLYGTHDIVAWYRSPGGGFFGLAPVGISGLERMQRFEALNALILARTGLLPRTFTPSVFAHSVSPQHVDTPSQAQIQSW
jgi:hypothetical protein